MSACGDELAWGTQQGKRRAGRGKQRKKKRAGRSRLATGKRIYKRGKERERNGLRNLVERKEGQGVWTRVGGYAKG